MNREYVNSRLSQLPIAMAGIVHVNVTDATRLSIYAHTISPCANRFLP